MTVFRRASQPKTSHKLLIVMALSLLVTLTFHFLRERRLLSNAHRIAANSATFPRDYWLGSGPELIYLAMGDSTAAGWGAQNREATYPHQVAAALAARNFRVHVVNVAVGGSTLQEVRRTQSPYLRGLKPDIVTISVGANDTTRGTAASDFEREMQALSADLAASSARTVLLANVPDMFLAPALPFPLARICGRRARALNARLEVMSRAAKIRLVDLYGRGKLDYQRDPQLYAADLFHPSGRGYNKWARLFVQELKLPPRVASISLPER